MTNLYEISVFLLGDLPHQFAFVYSILTLVLCVVAVLICFSPFILVYKIFNSND